MPLSLPSAADLDSPLDGSALQPTTDNSFRGPSFLMVVGPGLWSIQYRQAALHMLLQLWKSDGGGACPVEHPGQVSSLWHCKLK